MFLLWNLNKDNYALFNTNVGIGDDLLKPFNHLEYIEDKLLLSGYLDLQKQ